MTEEDFKGVKLGDVVVRKGTADALQKIKTKLCFDSVGECIEYVIRIHLEKYPQYR